MIYFNLPKSVYLKYREKINKTILKVLNSGNYIKSKELSKFEKNFAQYIKTKFAVGVGNATDAIFIALKALNIGYGDEVITVSHTATGTAMGILNTGAKPIFCDINERDFNIDISFISKKITKKTKAIIITHIYGFPVDMKKILAIAKRKNIKIIEDSAEMIGQTYFKKRCGTFGDLSTFSFYANKHITTGEGGMILTNNKKIYNKCKSLRNLCFGIGTKKFNHDDIGWNYRMTNVQAAIGCGQLKNISWIIRRKRQIGKRYIFILKNCNKIYIQPYKLSYAKNIFWVFGILLKKNANISRDQVIKKLLKHNIQTRNFFYPMHKQKIFKKMKLFTKRQKFPNSDCLSEKGFYLPSGLGITNVEIDFVAKTLLKIL